MNRQESPSLGRPSVVPFAPRHAPAFRDLNAAWITEHFRLEPKDLELLGDPQATILDHGGTILIAEVDGVAVGCCALILHSHDPDGRGDTLELGKMAVAASHRGRGIGRLLIRHAIAHARATGATRLYLESNTKLAPAIRLYESAGFRRIPASQSPPASYARVDITMELDLRPRG